jgi:dihydrolipoamide dehydrogenase
MSKSYDLVVLGGGIGGYSAAVRASSYGMKVAIVEEKKLGGTCLHEGCIPTKSYIESANTYRKMENASLFGIDGIDLKNCHINFPKVSKKAKSVVSTLHQGLSQLIKQKKIDMYFGRGTILGASIFSPLPGNISVEKEDGRDNIILSPKYVLIATGSKSTILSGLETDGQYIIDSRQALQMEVLPKSILIVGGGVIGLEWASMLAGFGVQVTVVEAAHQILPSMDQSLAQEAKKQLEASNITFLTDSTVLPETIKKDENLTVDIEQKEGGRQTLQVEKMMIAIGREGNTSNLGLENTSISIKDTFISTNEFYQTKEEHIYSVGDVIGKKQLAHAASHEGLKAVEHMVGEKPLPLKEEEIPTCIYTYPEMASVGLTEEEAKAQGLAVKVGQFPFIANGRALIKNETAGFVKVIVNEETNDLLGVHMIGPGATDLIAEASLAKMMDATPWEVTQAVHPHPSLSEAVWEAALAVNDKQIHM